VISRRKLVALLALVAAALAFALDLRVAHAEESKRARRIEHLDELPPWSLRLTVGGGVPLPNTHETLLGEEGYSGARWAYSAAIERRLQGAFGLGLLGLYGNRSLEAAPTEDNGDFVGTVSPRYSEQWWIAAVELPLSFLAGHFGAPNKDQWVELDLVPWAGVGGGSVGLYANSAWRSGPAFGGQARLLLRGRNVAGGFAAGAYSLRVTQPASVAGPIDFGMILFSAIGGFDVG
jgi:hypothetical protein